jgi:hypothetical protein
LKQKIKDEAAKKLKAAQPKKVQPKVVAETTKKASAATIAAKSQLPYDSSAPVSFIYRYKFMQNINCYLSCRH